MATRNAAGTNVDDKSARSVFVGNIPYEATEEKLKEIFSEVGKVLSFKLVYDRDNGKPRGYGFCEYPDPAMAMSAMRNLNGFEIGGRTLRVDSACTEKTKIEMQQVMGPAGHTVQGSIPGCSPSDCGPYGERVDSEKAPEAISKAVASLPPEQMFELMKQMKLCIQHNPQEARNMLLQNPQLAYALLQAQVVMRLVEPEMALMMLHKPLHPPMHLNSMGEPMSRSLPDSGSAMGQQLYQGGSQVPMRPDVVPPPLYENSFDGDRRGAGAQPTMDDHRFGGGRDPRQRDPRGGGADPRIGQRPSDARGPSTNTGPPQLPAHLVGADPARAQLIMQVLQLTDDQIAMFPEEQQLSIAELKTQINAIPK